MNLAKILKIAAREFLINIRRRSFLFAAIVAPLISILGTGVVIALVERVSADLSGFTKIGIVDQAGIFTENGQSTLENPLFTLIPSAAEGDSMLDAKTLDGYYVLSSNYVASGRVQAIKRRDNPMTEAVDDALLAEIKLSLSKRIGSDDLAVRIVDPVVEPTVYRIGDPTPLGESAFILAFLTPFLAVFLIFMATITGSQLLVSGLVEEKENRMMELLITSARPSEIMFGKVLGLGALGLAQVAIWITLLLGIALLRGTNLTQGLSSLQLTPTLLFISVTYFLLSYALIGVLMAGLGATASVEQEGQQLSGLITLILIVPFFFFASFITDPNGIAARVLSYFPLTAPVAMLMRYSFGGVPLSEVFVGIAIMIASIILVSFAAVRLFRLSILNYGKQLNLRQIINVILRNKAAISAPVVKQEGAA